MEGEAIPLLLRAEVTRDGATLVTHSVLVNQGSAAIRCDEDATPGDDVTLQLSFPGLLEPLVFEGRVAEVKLPQGVGEPGTWSLDFATEPEPAQRFAKLLASHAAGGKCSPYRALVVEDSRMSIEVLAVASKKFFGPRSGVRLDFAPTLAEAHELAQSHDYDLIIVDFFLPDGTGDELIRYLRQSEAAAGKAAIVATSVGGEDASKAAMAAGADFFVDKPVVMPALFETINFLRGLKS